MGRCFALGLILLLASPEMAAAQGSLSQPPRPGIALPPPAPPLNAGKKADCKLLPGGKAPVGPIADLPAPLSPRSLDLVYYGKRLADLTGADFQRIQELSKRCGPGDGILPPDKLERLQGVVREAQTARSVTIAWGKERMAEVEAMPVGRQRLMRLNNLWIELEARETQMTREDVDGLAAWIAREQQALYDAAPRWRPQRIPAQSATQQAVSTVIQPVLEVRLPPAAGRPRRQGGEDED
ncbi:MAG: hypothetical protein HYR63_22270 [Proteobacteria bacterium]|nr:hypothetical protein [Pseudomonadota bacterium]MBI3497574.1 hypothetical protein [Pseudomonadota bacterium]